MPDLAIRVDEKKYMWDKGEYSSEKEAKDKMSGYEKNGFMTHLIKEGKTFLIYTRRLVTEIVLEGEPPPG